MDPVDGPILASLLGKWSSQCSELHLDLWSRLEGAPPEGLSRLPPASHLQNCSLPLTSRLLRWSLFGRSLGYPSCWRGVILLVGGGREDSPGRRAPSPVCSAVGPCALEYTKMKTSDHFWTDPSADELVQRHRIHSSHLRQDSPTKRPALCVSGEDGGAPGGSPAEFWTRRGGGEWTAALMVTQASPATSPHVARSRKGIRVAAWTTGPPSPPVTMWSPCIRTPAPPCSTARTTFWSSRWVRVPILGPGLPLRVWLQVTEEGGPCGPRFLIHLSIHPLTDPTVRSSANISISPSVHPQDGISFYPFVHPFICQCPTQPASQLSSSLFIHPSLCSCIHSPFFVHLPVFISIQPPIHSSIPLSIITSTHTSIHPSTHHHLHPSIIHPPIFNFHLSICSFVFQSIYPLPFHPAVLSIILPHHHSLTQFPHLCWTCSARGA